MNKKTLRSGSLIVKICVGTANNEPRKDSKGGIMYMSPLGIQEKEGKLKRGT